MRESLYAETTVFPAAHTWVSDWVTLGKVPSPPVMMFTSVPP